jgi:hypothetical protein
VQEKWRNKVFNIVAVYNLGLDLQAAEEFAARSEVADLGATFAELRDLVGLLLREDFDHYVEDDALRLREYSHIEPSRAVALLSKCVSGPRG